MPHMVSFVWALHGFEAITCCRWTAVDSICRSYGDSEAAGSEEKDGELERQCLRGLNG